MIILETLTAMKHITKPKSLTVRTKATFTGLDDSTAVVGMEVSIRLDRFVLDISETDDFGGPYLIVGKPYGSFYAGKDEGVKFNSRAARDTTIDEDIAIARWALLGDVYVGIWFEHGRELLFSFRLPKQKGTTS